MTGPLEIVQGDADVVCDDDGFCVIPGSSEGPTDPSS